jgi:hypothetical protein
MECRMHIVCCKHTGFLQEYYFERDIELPVVPHKAVAEVSKIGNL